MISSFLGQHFTDLRKAVLRKDLRGACTWWEEGNDNMMITLYPLAFCFLPFEKMDGRVF